MNTSKYSIISFFLKPYKWLYSVILISTLAASVMESVAVLAFFPLLTTVLDTPVHDQGTMLTLINKASGLFPFSEPLIASSMLLVVVFVIKTALNLTKDCLIARSASRVLFDIKNQIMDKYSIAKYQFYLDNQQGNLIYDSQIAPHRVGVLLLRIPLMVSEILKVIAIGAMLAAIAPYAVLSISILAVCYFGVINLVSNKIMYNLGQRKAEAYSSQTIIAEEYFSGIRNIIAFRAVEHWLERFRRSNRIFSDLQGKDLILNNSPKHIVQLFAILLMTGFIVVFWMVSPGELSLFLPELGLFAVALTQLLPSITGIGNMRMEVMSGLADLERVHFIMTDNIQSRSVRGIELRSFKRSIKFENVSFAYPGREALIKNANMLFERGKVTALVGPSGAGKTTIINLILGFFDPVEGQIKIDDVSIDSYSLDSRLQKMGLVSQDGFLYHASITDNVKLGRNVPDFDMIAEASTISNADQFIENLPDGFNTIVGDKGMKLSGGQQQRVAIARAVLEKPEILIFDEATSSLDNIAEEQVQRAIEKASIDRTVIIVAHRLSTVRYADKIIVLDNGQIVEEGNHHALMELKGRYFELVALSK